MKRAHTGGSVPEILKEAAWIWPENSSWDLYNCYALFRKAFDLPAAPGRAIAYVTADQSYQLYANGNHVCRGPARGFQAHWPYDEVDLASYLKVGRNVIAIRAYNPGIGTFQYTSQGAAGMLFGLQLGRGHVVSDPSWKSRRQSGVQKDAVQSSMQLFPQEILDSRVEADDWMTPDFDDSSWGNGLVSARWNGMPWPGLEARMIPLLQEEKVAPRALLGVSEGQCAAGYERTRDVALLRWQENMEHAPASGSPGIIEVAPTGAGHYRSYLIDFGRTVVGSLGLSVEGGAGGEIIDTLHTETIDQEKLKPDLLIPSWCRMAFSYRLYCRPGKTRHDFYHVYGFRYLTLTVRDATRPLKLEVCLNRVGYPLERKGSFRSSDEVLKQIWEISAWTQQCCSLDAYVDTPWREQAQWWGDARVQSWNTFHLSGDARLCRRGIHCIASQTTPNGLTYGHAPTIAHTCILPDFTLIWMLTLWDHYWQTGSLEAFRSHEATVEKSLGYFQEQTDRKTGLVGFDPRYWLFLDWTGIFKDGYPAVYNLWLLITLEKVAELQRLSRRPQKAGATLAWARKVRAALAVLIDKKTGLMRDGMRFDGGIVETTCVHSQVLAIMAGLYPAGEQAMLDKVLVPYLHGELKTDVHPSAYWITYLYSVLAERGHARDVVAHIRRRWEPMIAHGTTFENFEPIRGDTSHSHAWSAHPLFHLMQTIGGIRQIAPKWKKISFRPEFVGESGGAVVPSPLGPISSEWERQGGTVAVKLRLPEGVEAVVQLPGRKIEKVSGRKQWKATIPQ
jgi:hypothetical protein